MHEQHKVICVTIFGTTEWLARTTSGININFSLLKLFKGVSNPKFGFLLKIHNSLPVPDFFLIFCMMFIYRLINPLVVSFCPRSN